MTLIEQLLRWSAEWDGTTDANLCKKAAHTIEYVKKVLEDCEEYFDQRADADQPPGISYPIGNEEMRLLSDVRSALVLAVSGELAAVKWHGTEPPAMQSVCSSQDLQAELKNYANLAPLDLLKPREIQADLLAIAAGNAPPSQWRYCF